MTNLHDDGLITCEKYKKEHKIDWIWSWWNRHDLRVKKSNLTWLIRKNMAEISFSMEYRFDINVRW